jgi:hypothetical protein
MVDSERARQDGGVPRWVEITVRPHLGAVASRVLGPFLEDQGFAASVLEEARAEFRRGDLLLELSYYS